MNQIWYTLLLALLYSGMGRALSPAALTRPSQRWWPCFDYVPSLPCCCSYSCWKKFIFRLWIVLEACFVIAKYAVVWDLPRVGSILSKKVITSAGLTLAWFHLTFLANALKFSDVVSLEIPNPHPARVVIPPPCLDVMFDTAGVGEVLNAIDILGREDLVPVFVYRPKYRPVNINYSGR